MGEFYHQDYIGWTEQQARLLREAAARRTNVALDWTHLAEEIEDWGRSELHDLASQIRRIILHLLKLQFSSAAQPRAGWIETIDDARAEIQSRLRRDPGLRPRVSELIVEEAPVAVRLAVRALRAYGEDAAGIVAGQVAGEVYSQHQILGDWFPGVDD
jgi:hypothetical protein